MRHFIFNDASNAYKNTKTIPVTRDQICNGDRNALFCGNGNNGKGRFNGRIFGHRIILKKVPFNVTLLVTVFKSDEKCDDIILKNTVSYNIMRYGDASGINSIEIL